MRHCISLRLSLAFCPCLYKYEHCLYKAFGDLRERVLWKTFSVCYLQDTSPSPTSRFGPTGLPFSCASASAATFKHPAGYLSTCANALLSMSLAVMARTRGRDVPRLSSHFCHVCCGEKQEGIFNRRTLPLLVWQSPRLVTFQAQCKPHLFPQEMKGI